MPQSNAVRHQLDAHPARSADSHMERLMEHPHGGECLMQSCLRLGRKQCVSLSPEQGPCHSAPAVAAQDTLPVCDPSGKAKVAEGCPPECQEPEERGDRLSEDARESDSQDSQPETPISSGLARQARQALSSGSRACNLAHDLPVTGSAILTPAPARQQWGKAASQSTAAPVLDIEAQPAGLIGKLLALVSAELPDKSRAAPALPQWLTGRLERFPDCLLAPCKTGEVVKTPHGRNQLVSVETATCICTSLRLRTAFINHGLVYAWVTH